MREQARISLSKNRAMIRQRVRVLLEGRSKQSALLLEGRAESQAPEIDGSILINDLPDGADIRPGDFVTVEITDALEYDLIGRVVQESGVGGQGSVLRVHHTQTKSHQRPAPDP